MADILVVKGLHRSILVPQTQKGERWLRENVDRVMGSEPAMSINAEFTEDMVNALKENGLEVDVK